MEKRQDAFTKQARNSEAKSQNPGNHAARQAQPQHDAPGQDLMAPRWRGPFEGYR